MKVKYVVLGLVLLVLYIVLVSLLGSKEDDQVHLADEWEQTGGQLVHTQEYQLKLFQAEWRNRTARLETFLSTISSYSKPWFTLSRQASKENIREQIFVDHTKRCGERYSFRIRNYIWGDDIGTSTIDVKVVSNNEGIELVETATNLDPSPAVRASSILKLEKDVHPCKADKWSKETRITDVVFRPQVSTCQDLSDFFPDLWKDYPHLQNQEVSMREPEWWWQLSQHGRFSDGTKWKSAFTLRYDSLEEAKVGYDPKQRGEWSLRIYASDEGRGPWNEPLVDEINKLYFRLVEALGSDKEWPCED